MRYGGHLDSEQLILHDMVPDAVILANNGREIARARCLRGLSRRELAELAGIHNNTIACIERGERDINGLTQARIFATLGFYGIEVKPDRHIILLDHKRDLQYHRDMFATPDSRKIHVAGDAIFARRIALQMSLETLASIAGLHRNTVWNLEQGLVNPGGLTMHRIYRALGVSLVIATPTEMTLS